MDCDGVLNVDEEACGGRPTAFDPDMDLDGDGVCNGLDPDVDGDGFVSPADCMDHRADVFQGAPDTADDGIDQGCSGHEDLLMFDPLASGTTVFTSFAPALLPREVRVTAGVIDVVEGASATTVPLVHPAGFRAASFLEDGRLLALAADRTTWIYDDVTQAPRRALTGAPVRNNAGSFVASSAGLFFVQSSADEVWHFDGQSEVFRFIFDEGFGDVSLRGNVLGYADQFFNRISIFDVPSGTLTTQFTGVRSGPPAVLDDGRVFVLLNTGLVELTLDGTDTVQTPVFSPPSGTIQSMRANGHAIYLITLLNNQSTLRAVSPIDFAEIGTQSLGIGSDSIAAEDTELLLFTGPSNFRTRVALNLDGSFGETTSILARTVARPLTGTTPRGRSLPSRNHSALGPRRLGQVSNGFLILVDDNDQRVGGVNGQLDRFPDSAAVNGTNAVTASSDRIRYYDITGDALSINPQSEVRVSVAGTPSVAVTSGAAWGCSASTNASFYLPLEDGVLGARTSTDVLGRFCIDVVAEGELLWVLRSDAVTGGTLTSLSLVDVTDPAAPIELHREPPWRSSPPPTRPAQATQASTSALES